ncbi:MAG: hypothetical protein ACLQPD_04900 [Desulfomonilaceae bacterium]
MAWIRITLFVMSLLLFVAGAILSYQGKTGGASATYGAAVFCLIFVSLEQFKSFKGWGIEAELRNRAGIERFLGRPTGGTTQGQKAIAPEERGQKTTGRVEALESTVSNEFPEGLKLIAMHHMKVHFEGVWANAGDRWRKDVTVNVPVGTKVATVAVTQTDVRFIRDDGQLDPKPLGRVNYEIVDIEPRDTANGKFKFVFAAFLDAGMPQQKWSGEFRLRILCFGSER